MDDFRSCVVKYIIDLVPFRKRRHYLQFFFVSYHLIILHVLQLFIQPSMYQLA